MFAEESEEFNWLKGSEHHLIGVMQSTNLALTESKTVERKCTNSHSFIQLGLKGNGLEMFPSDKSPPLKKKTKNNKWLWYDGSPALYFRINLSSFRGGGDGCERWVMNSKCNGVEPGQHINTSHKSAIIIVYRPRGFTSKNKKQKKKLLQTNKQANNIAMVAVKSVNQMEYQLETKFHSTTCRLRIKVIFGEPTDAPSPQFPPPSRPSFCPRQRLGC